MVMTIGFVLIAFFEFRIWAFFCALVVVNVILYFTHIGKPRRQDYSLFLRAQNGLLGGPQEGPVVASKLTAPQLRAFVQFLGQHNMITDFRFRHDGLLLHLSPVVEDVIRTFFFLESSSCMHIDWQGRCQASLGRSDRRQLERLGTPVDDGSTREEDVARVVEATLTAFLAGKTGTAEALLQAEPDKAVVIDTPRMLKEHRALFGIPVLVTVLWLLVAFPFLHTGSSARIVNTFSTGEANGSVTVSFWGRSTEETITAALYEASQGVRPQVDFPPASEESYRKSALQIQEGRTSSFRFINLKPGQYTVGAIHKKRGIVGNTRTLTSSFVNVPAGARVEVEIRP